MFILTNVSQDESGRVYAGKPGFFPTEEDAVRSAEENLAEDYDISVEDLRYEAQSGGKPYVLSMSRDGRFEAYTVSEIPEPESIKAETPEGTIIAEVKGAKDEYPGIWIFKDGNQPDSMMAAVEYSGPDKKFQTEVYQADAEEPCAIIDYATGEDLL